MKNLHSINKEQKLYVLKSGSGFSCLGFKVVLEKIKKLSAELEIKPKKFRSGSRPALRFYYQLIELAAEKNKKTGWKSKSELVPDFIGHEGKRVEVLWTYGEKSRFKIGKSTGWIPCHLEIKTARSTGGLPIYPDLIKSWRFI